MNHRSLHESDKQQGFDVIVNCLRVPTNLTFIHFSRSDR